MLHTLNISCKHSCETEAQCQLQNLMMGLHGDVTFSIAIICDQLYIAPESTCSLSIGGTNDISTPLVEIVHCQCIDTHTLAKSQPC